MPNGKDAAVELVRIRSIGMNDQVTILEKCDSIWNEIRRSSFEPHGCKDIADKQAAQNDITNSVYQTAFSIQVPIRDPNKEGGIRSRDETEQGITETIVLSILIMVLTALSWTGATQFSKSTLISPTFRAPYFLVWFNTNWMIVCFPLYLIPAAAAWACSVRSSKSPHRLICDSSLVFGPSGLTVKTLFTRSVPFVAVWIIANYSYGQALMNISAAETTIVFSSNIAFVYLLSWIFLHDKFLALRTLAILLSIVGIVLMVQAGGIGTMTFIGVICAVIASAASAIYKVLFKKVIGDVNFGQVCCFMSVLGLCNLLMSWPISLLLIMTSAESINWDDLPWQYICGSAILGLLFNLLVNFGVAYTHPVYVSIGIFLGLPVNAAVDAILRGVTLNGLQIVGATCILCSFLLLILPEDFGSNLLRRLGITRQS